ncbi:MAG: BolA family transcriptional regulator [Hyphomonadaceae bacterium]|nr:BolA family transcriptional regulator [Hyphomonadaceae bacterium]MBC6412878.1 BolA family transcriptional regulator [Hyphomonadaceae bacterium]
MAMNGTDIADMIREALPDAEVEMIDLAGDNNHWKAIIVSSAFEGLSRLRQHQLVYGALKGKMDGAEGELHALALETRAPDP